MSQTAKNVAVRYKVEGTFNTAPGATGAKELRFTSSPGMALQRADILSQEIRPDGLSSGTRKGSFTVPGQYNAELSVGSFDEIFEAIMRSTWVAAVVITEATASLTSITTTTSTIVAGGGSWITAGVRAGDIVRLTNHATAANNSVNVRVKTVSALTITAHGTPLTADAVADTAFTLTILKKLKNGATPTRRSFYVDEYMGDNDISEVFGGTRWVSLKIAGAADGMATLTIGALGVSGDALGTGASPYYTAYTSYTSIPLVFVDAAISIGGVDIATLGSFEFTYAMPASTYPTIGGTTSPDVFDEQATVSGSFTGLKADATNLSRLKNETEFEIHIMCVEPDASVPKDCIGFYLPKCKVGSPTKTFGGTGALEESVPFTAGAREAASGYDATLMTISTSAA